MEPLRPLEYWRASCGLKGPHVRLQRRAQVILGVPAIARNAVTKYGSAGDRATVVTRARESVGQYVDLIIERLRPSGQESYPLDSTPE